MSESESESDRASRRKRHERILTEPGPFTTFAGRMAVVSSAGTNAATLGKDLLGWSRRF